MLKRTGQLLRLRSSPWFVFFIVFLIVAGTTAFMTFILPESYTSAARIKVGLDHAAVAATEQTQSASSRPDPSLFQTEFEVIQSASVLNKVINALDLNTAWGKKYAAGAKLESAETLALLKGRLDLRPIRGTSLIEIRAFSENPKEAANIANAVAEAYREYRLEKGGQLPNSEVKTLKGVLEDQEQSIRETQKQVDKLLSELNAPQLEADVERQLQSHLISFETQLAREQTQLKELAKLSPDRRRDAIQTSVGPDPELTTLVGELNLAEQRLLSLQKDYAPDHPTMQDARMMADDLRKRVTARVEGVMIGLANRVSAARATVDILKTSLEAARSKKAEQARPYYDATQRLENLKHFRAILATKLASEKVEMQLPRSIPVEIIDKAVPGARPVRPNKPLNLFWGTVGGALAALVALLIGRNSWKKSVIP